jgi:hypothetical protein
MRSWARCLRSISVIACPSGAAPKAQGALLIAGEAFAALGQRDTRQEAPKGADATTPENHLERGKT